MLRLCCLFCFIVAINASYRIGVGIGDITGPPAEIAFMGYGHIEQKGTGIHTRQFARSFIIDDHTRRLVFVSLDCGMIGTGLLKKVISGINQKYGDVYSEQNVMLSGTHTHSTPGGFLQHLLFDLNTFGFVEDTFDALVNGTVQSIIMAHENVREGRLYLAQGELLNANINRSPASYLANPESERMQYRYNVDKVMSQLQFRDSYGEPLGVINWFSVHATSMNNTNTLVSSDNLGYASLQFEKWMNKGKLLGKGPFVAAFASSNEGDVSPNIRGARCIDDDTICNDYTSTCPKRSPCIAFGPGDDMFKSTKIIADRLFEKAKDLWIGYSAKEITGSVHSRHQYVNMPEQHAEKYNDATGEIEQIHACIQGLGYSFAAGTTDGPGPFSFHQGTKSGNPLWNLVRNAIATPPESMVECHKPKPILLPTGLMNFPFDWHPSIVSTSLATIGNLAIVCVPGEFTTMSGRRVRNTIKDTLSLNSASQVIIAGLCNTYAHYVTTYEEYQVQRYEGGSTIFGPHTLLLYQNQYKNLANAIQMGVNIGPGPEPKDLSSQLLSFHTPVVFDSPIWGHKFGDCIQRTQDFARPGETVQAKFVAGHPRNNRMNGGTYLSVERKDEYGNWKIVATDADWETKFYWERNSGLFGTSSVLITWDIGQDVVPGEYRIRHFGSYKYIFGGKFIYNGTCNVFQVEGKNGHMVWT